MIHRSCHPLLLTKWRPRPQKKHFNRFFSLLEKSQAITILRRTDAVCFDVDSTVIDEEGIDVLADHNGAGEAVSEWTRKYVISYMYVCIYCMYVFIIINIYTCRAMGGQVLFHDALAARLDLIKPSRNDIDSCLKKHPLKLTQGVKEFISKLHGKGIPVYLVSGGFRQVKNNIDHL